MKNLDCMQWCENYQVQFQTNTISQHIHKTQGIKLKTADFWRLPGRKQKHYGRTPTPLFFIVFARLLLFHCLCAGFVIRVKQGARWENTNKNKCGERIGRGSCSRYLTSPMTYGKNKLRHLSLCNYPPSPGVCSTWSVRGFCYRT